MEQEETWNFGNKKAGVNMWMQTSLQQMNRLWNTPQ
jgi:hypothetical protein